MAQTNKHAARTNKVIRRINRRFSTSIKCVTVDASIAECNKLDGLLAMYEIECEHVMRGEVIA